MIERLPGAYSRIFLTLTVTSSVLLSLLAIILRSASGDEFGTIWVASLPSIHAVASFIQANDIHPPLPYILLHLWGTFVGFDDFAMRSLSLVYTLICIPILKSILCRWRPAISSDQIHLVLILCASSPVLWVQAGVARYYSLSTLVGLLSMLVYLRWLENPSWKRWVVFVVMTAATFRIHFLLATLVIFSQLSHFLSHARLAPRSQRIMWFLAEVSVAALSLPIIVSTILPILMGANGTVALAPTEGSNGLMALPLYIAGHLFATLTGAVPFPWDFWVTVPMCIVCMGVICRDMLYEKLWSRRIVVCWVTIPLLLLPVAIDYIAPVSGYFMGIYRVGHIAVLAWACLGVLTLHIQARMVRRFCFGTLLTANAICMTIYGTDAFSMLQSTPLKGAANIIRASTPLANERIVFHPFNYGWGDITGWGDSLQRYLPDTTCRIVTDEIPNVPLDDYEELLRTTHYDNVWVIKRLRFPQKATELTTWMSQNDYQIVTQVPLQKQRSYDIWFKTFLKSIPALGYSSNAPATSYWMMECYESGETAVTPGTDLASSGTQTIAAQAQIVLLQNAK